MLTNRDKHESLKHTTDCWKSIWKSKKTRGVTCFLSWTKRERNVNETRQSSLFEWNKEDITLKMKGEELNINAARRLIARNSACSREFWRTYRAESTRKKGEQETGRQFKRLFNSLKWDWVLWKKFCQCPFGIRIVFLFFISSVPSFPIVKKVAFNNGRSTLEKFDLTEAENISLNLSPIRSNLEWC